MRRVSEVLAQILFGTGLIALAATIVAIIVKSSAYGAKRTIATGLVALTCFVGAFIWKKINEPRAPS